MIAQSTYDGFTDEQKEAFDKAAEEAKDYQREYSSNYNKDALDNMKEVGVTVTEVDKDVWKDAANAVYDQLDSLKLNRELVEKIQSSN